MSMKCDCFIFTSTFFRWGGYSFHVCVKCFFLLKAVQKLFKSSVFFQSYDHKCTAMFFSVHRSKLNVANIIVNLFCCGIKDDQISFLSCKLIVCHSLPGVLLHCHLVSIIQCVKWLHPYHCYQAVKHDVVGHMTRWPSISVIVGQ